MGLVWNALLLPACRRQNFYGVIFRLGVALAFNDGSMRSSASQRCLPGLDAGMFSFHVDAFLGGHLFDSAELIRPRAEACLSSSTTTVSRSSTFSVGDGLRGFSFTVAGYSSAASLFDAASGHLGDATGEHFLSACTFLVPSSFGSMQRQILLAPVLLDSPLVPYAHGDGRRFNSLLDYLEESFTAWALSFMAMITAALLRLLFFATGLRGGPTNCDPIVRSGRGVLRGVPFAFVFTAYLLMPAAHGMPHGGTGDGMTAAAEAYARLSAMDLAFQLSQDHTPLLLECTPGDPTPPVYVHDRPEPGVDPFEDPEEPVEQQSVPVRVFTFQRADHYLCTWITPGMRSAEALRDISNIVLEDAGEFAVVAVQPQLPDDVLSTLVFPTWWRLTPDVPVVFDCSATWTRPFMGKVPRNCSLDDMQKAYGSRLPVGMGFFVQNDPRPVDATERRDVRVGALIRVRLLGETLVEMPDFQEAIDDLYWMRDITVAGMPHAPSPSGTSLMIGPSSSFTSNDASEHSLPELHAVLAVAFDTEVENSMLCACQALIDEAAFRGVPFETTWAVAPKLSEENPGRWTGVFIDPRDFGENIIFHVFRSKSVSPDEVIAALGFTAPEHHVVMVAVGNSTATDARRPITHGCLITVWVEEAPDSDEAMTETDTSANAANGLANDSHSWRRPFYMSMKVYGVQVEPTVLRLSVLPEDDINSIIIEILSVELDVDGQHTLVAISPQPADDSLVFAMTANWITLQNRFPAMIDATAFGFNRFIIMLADHLTLSDVQDSFGADWPDAAVVWLPGHGIHMEPGRRVPTGNGMLVLVIDPDLPARFVGSRRRTASLSLRTALCATLCSEAFVYTWLLGWFKTQGLAPVSFSSTAENLDTTLLC